MRLFRTGNGTPTRKPAFFDEVDKFLSEKPCTKPKVVINFSQIFIGGGTESRTENSEEGEGNVENIVVNLPSCISSSSSSDSNNINNRGRNSKCLELQKDACVTHAGELSKLSLIGKPNNRPRQNVSVRFNINACAVS